MKQKEEGHWRSWSENGREKGQKQRNKPITVGSQNMGCWLNKYFTALGFQTTFGDGLYHENSWVSSTISVCEVFSFLS